MIAAMKFPILSCAIVLTLALCALNAVYADSATWSTNPTNGDWNNPANWTPATVPNGPNDIATFGVSSITGISINASIEVNSIIFSPGGSAFTITPSPANGAIVLTISGAGITNSSEITQNFVTYGDEDSSSFIFFTNSATAGSGTLFTCNPGPSLGGNGQVNFYDTATAGDATIVSNGGWIFFTDDSTAADATIIVNGDDGHVILRSVAANNATLVAKSGQILISGAGSNTARVQVYDRGILYIGEIGPGALVGSIEGDGEIIISIGETFRVGSNNLNTVFSGVIRDALHLESSYAVRQTQPEIGGTLAKVGTGKLRLTGANTYSIGTNVKAGTLVVANTEGSGTGPGPVKVTSGRLGGNGVIAGETRIGTGSGTGAFLAPAAGTTVQATLTIQSALTFNSDATYAYTFRANRNRAETDEVIANGVTINSGAMIELNGHTRGAVTQGMVLTLISNTSADPISGTFSNLPDGSIVTINGNNFQASYSGGDGNDLTLTVVP